MMLSVYDMSLNKYNLVMNTMSCVVKYPQKVMKPKVRTQTTCISKSIDIKQSNKRHNQNSKSKRQDYNMK